VEGLAGFVVPAIVVVILALVAYAGYVQAKRRREEMAAYAVSRGWRFELDQPALVHRFHGAPFGRGDDRRAFNVVYGTHDGRDFVSFDYEYEETTGSGKDRRTTTYDFSVLAMSMTVVMPALEVSPEGFFGRLVGRLTNSDIELELEDFNRAFTVQCPDRKFASDVLHPQMMEFLMQYRDMAWRFERDSMLMVTQGRRTIPRIDWTMQVMDGIADRIPEFVWRQLRGHA
jgi:hypothetical protein